MPWPSSESANLVNKSIISNEGNRKLPTPNISTECVRSVASPSELRHCFQQPKSVTRSLPKRDGFDLEKGLYLWWNTRFSFRQKANRTRIVVDYDHLIDDPASELTRISQALGLTFNLEGPEFAEYQAQVVGDTCHHTRYREDDLKLDKAGPATARTLYTAFLGLSTDG